MSKVEDPEPELKEIPAKEILDKIQRGDPIEYDHFRIKGNLDLSQVDLPTKHIERTQFQKASGLTENVKIVQSTIHITNSVIKGLLNFSNSIFTIVYFTGTKFNNADFSGAEFSNYADFRDAKFSGEARFSSAKFRGNALFLSAQFDGNAVFHKAQFRGDISFCSAKFRGNAFFMEAQFRGDANFMAAKLSGDVGFAGAQIEKMICLDLMKYDRLYISWEILKGHIEYNGETYLSLIKNFRNLEQFKDADSCYYHYRKKSQTIKDWYVHPNRVISFFIYIHSQIMEQLKWITDLYERLNKIPPFLWFHRFNWSKLADHLSWISCGYGLKIWPMLLWIAGTILVFAYIYSSFGGVANDIGNASPIDSLFFSTFALFSKTPPDGIHTIGPWKYAVLIENLLGYVFLALFVVVLGRKIAR